MRPVLFADDPQFWFETLRTMGHAAYGGADIAEVLTTAQNIVAGDYDSWHDEWLATADRIAAEGETQLAAGHRVSARDGLLRANNYLPGRRVLPPRRPHRPAYRPRVSPG